MSEADVTRTCPMCGALAVAGERRCASCGEEFGAQGAIQKPLGRLYSPLQIGIAAFLGGPIAACWFLFRNFRALEERRNANWCLVWAVLGTAALLGVSLLLPSGFPSQAIPTGYTIGLYLAAKQLQGKRVLQHVAAGGRLGSWWAIVGISLISLVLIFAALFAVIIYYGIPGGLIAREAVQNVMCPS